MVLTSPDTNMAEKWVERDQWLAAAVKAAPYGQKDSIAGLGGGLTSHLVGLVNLLGKGLSLGMWIHLKWC